MRFSINMLSFTTVAVASIRQSGAFVTKSSFTRSISVTSKRAYSSTTLNMKLQTAIVGLPNVGKSTLFNALTESQGAEAANYPFCTIEVRICVTLLSFL